MSRNRFTGFLSAFAVCVALANPVFCQENADQPVSQPLYYTPGSPVASITPEAISQGQIGDCYFLGALASLAQLNPAAIVNMIKDNNDGTFTVTFPGAPTEPITVSQVTNGEQVSFAHWAPEGTWPGILEKAYGAYCNKHFWRRGLFNLFGSSVPAKGADGGSCLDAGLRILTPAGVSTDSTTFSRYSTIADHLSSALAQKRPVTVETSVVHNNLNLPKQHIYGVLAFQPNQNDVSQSLVTIRNPWGNVDGAGPNGSNAGTFTLTLEQLCSVFDQVEYADSPVTETSAPVTATTTSSTETSTTAGGSSTGGSTTDQPTGTTTQNDPAHSTTSSASSGDARATNETQTTGASSSSSTPSNPYMPLLPSMIKHQEIVNGTRTTLMTDGTQIVEEPSGYKHFTLEGGKQYWEIPGYARIWEEPDGFTTIQYPDGTEVGTWPNGRTITTKPDGSTTAEGGGGPKIITDKNGNRTVVESSGKIVHLDSEQPRITLENETKTGALKVSLKGDGKTTSHATLILANADDTPKHITIPKYECFLPSNSSSQTMMTTETSPMFDVPPHGTVQAEIPMVCVSTKTKKPPSSEATAYTPAQLADKKDGRVLAAILEASKTLDEKHIYQNAPIAPQRRAHTVAQLAIWQYMSKDSASPADKITDSSVKKEMCEAAHLDESKLNKNERKELNTGIEKIMACVDLTAKEGQEVAQISLANDAARKNR